MYEYVSYLVRVQMHSGDPGSSCRPANFVLDRPTSAGSNDGKDIYEYVISTKYPQPNPYRKIHQLHK